MSEQGIIFGCIFAGGPLGSSKSLEFYQHNKTMIDSLPESIDWRKELLLSKDMFTTPMPDWSGFYRVQMIHFGASINHLDSYWEAWRTQFEALLRKLYWFDAYLYIEAELTIGRTEFHWKANKASMFEFPPHPIATWELTIRNMGL